MKALITIALGLGLMFFGRIPAGASPDTLCGTVSGTLTLAGSPYIVTCNVLVPNGNTLTIEPGVQIRFNGLYAIQVNGTLIAQGSSGNRIVFTSNKSTPAPGDWREIFFSQSGSGSRLDYCDVLYGGAGVLGTVAAVNMWFSSPSVSNTTVQFSSTKGIHLSESSPSITNSTISDNGGMGIEATDVGADPIISNCSIANNGSYPISMFADNVRNIGSVTLTGNATQGIRVEGENVNTAVWRNHGVPYVLDGSVTVNEVNSLIIEPGNELRFNGLYSLQVNGTLWAHGTPGNHIVFTSNRTVPAPGDWRELFFNFDSLSSLNYCEVLYAGSHSAALNLQGSNGITISNTSIRYSLLRGINNVHSFAIIRGCLIADNGGDGVHISSGAPPVAPDLGTGASPGNNSFRDNGGWEVYNNTSTTVYAMHNFWVATDSATIDTLHIYDDDENPAKGMVIFSPWLMNDPTDVDEDPKVEIPGEFRLHQNYPNPFNPSTRIRYDLPEQSRVTLTVYNLLGQEVAQLFGGEQQAGRQEITWGAASFASGFYFYRMEAHSYDGTHYVETRKMLLLK